MSQAPQEPLPRTSTTTTSNTSPTSVAPVSVVSIHSPISPSSSRSDNISATAKIAASKYRFFNHFHHFWQTQILEAQDRFIKYGNNLSDTVPHRKSLDRILWIWLCDTTSPQSRQGVFKNLDWTQRLYLIQAIELLGISSFVFDSGKRAPVMGKGDGNDSDDGYEVDDDEMNDDESEDNGGDDDEGDEDVVVQVDSERREAQSRRCQARKILDMLSQKQSESMEAAFQSEKDAMVGAVKQSAHDNCPFADRPQQCSTVSHRADNDNDNDVDDGKDDDEDILFVTEEVLPDSDQQSDDESSKGAVAAKDDESQQAEDRKVRDPNNDTCTDDQETQPGVGSSTNSKNNNSDYSKLGGFGKAKARCFPRRVQIAQRYPRQPTSSVKDLMANIRDDDHDDDDDDEDDEDDINNLDYINTYSSMRRSVRAFKPSQFEIVRAVTAMTTKCGACYHFFRSEDPKYYNWEVDKLMCKGCICLKEYESACWIRQ